MKKLSVVTAFFCLLFAANAVFAQNKTANFAGTWELDVAKSKLPERMRVESMTLSVAQTDKEIKVETNSKRAARPEGERPAGDGGMGGGLRQGGGMGRGGGGMMGGGNGTVSYSLDGKEMIVKSESTDGIPAPSIMLKANTEKDGKLKLSSSRSFETPNGAITTKTTETWELIDGGKGLKITRDMETPRGMQSSEMYFTKKAVSGMKTILAPVSSDKGLTVFDKADSSSGTSKTMIGGEEILNYKAKKLVTPKYPQPAHAVKAGGAVSVKVVINEKGNIISAEAITGHPLLKSASEEAARKAKFAPRLIDNQPVKVTGVLLYYFLP